MSMKGITDHATQRSIERYGFAPNHLEVRQILDDCRTGKAPCLRKNDIGRQHVVRIRGGLMIVCLSLTEPVIITIFPRDYFNAGRSAEHHQKAYGAKQKPKASKAACNPEYNRAALKNELRQSREDF